MKDDMSETGLKFEIRWEEIEKQFKDYLSKINANVKQPDRIEKILSISYDEMQKLGYEECGENAYLLNQQACYLQQEYNSHKAKLDWCDSNLSYLIEKNYVDSGQFKKREDKAAKIAINNSGVQSLLKMLYTAKTYVTVLESMPARMSALAHSWEQLQYTKRKLS
jgi:hypothetical protein